MGGGGGGDDEAGSDEDDGVGGEGGRGYDGGGGVDGGESDGDGGGGGDEDSGVMLRAVSSCGSLSTSGRSKSGEVERRVVTRRLAMTAARLLTRLATRAALDFFDALLVGGVCCLV